MKAQIGQIQRNFSALCLALILGVTAIAMDASAASVAGRHVYMIHPGVETVWGTYLLVVENPSGQPTQHRIPVTLPEETIDFQPQQGVRPQQLLLDDEGLVIEAEFTQPSTLVAIGFQVPAPGGKGKMTIVPRLGMDEFAIMIPEPQLEVEASGFTFDPDVIFARRQFATWYRDDLPAGQSFVVNVSNVPRGRGQFWLIGSIFAAALLSGALTLSLRTRPSDEDLKGDIFGVVEGGNA